MQGKEAAQSGNLATSAACSRSRSAAGQLAAARAPLAAHAVTPPDTADAASIATGELFGQYCSACHGNAAVGGGVIPDLRKSPFLPMDVFYNIVLDGLLESNGMAEVGAVLDRPAVTAIRAYIVHRAHEDKVASAERSASRM